MSAYCARPNGRAKLLRTIKDRLDYIGSFPELYRQATAFHHELSTIPSVETIVTTNWDTYFEQECGAIPFVSAEDYVFAEMPGRKVFKIHGSIHSYGSIVATREDYERCRKGLATGLLGSTLKLLLATKTLVYIGFSFSDDDFTRIHDALTAEMRGLRPHGYLVTLDRSSPTRFAEKGLTPICTDGTFFLAKVKERLISDGHMLHDERFAGIESLMATVLEAHEDLAKIDARTYPDVIYGLCYQDGLIHSLERILSLRKTGRYSDPKSTRKTAEAYFQGLRPQKLKKGRYHDVAYIDGYINGLIHLLASDKDRKTVPIYYAFGIKEPIRDKKQHMKSLRKAQRSSRKEHRWAVNLVQKRGVTDGIVPHHTPFLF
jgi:hypothetical protein